ncbi:hypothetical protein [Qipengyuania nanhaisediminis]|uniref:hypothetical protein n=1 Tax=Qipengyuania nanhaisediminis TaxID=604088 RepID=UPI0038B30A66
MPRPDDYETPRTPPATPPVVDPDVDPEATAALEREVEKRQGTKPGQRADPDEVDPELAASLRRRQELDGAGEEELDATTPTTLLPPD